MSNITGINQEMWNLRSQYKDRAMSILCEALEECQKFNPTCVLVLMIDENGEERSNWCTINVPALIGSVEVLKAEMVDARRGLSD